MSRDPMNDNPNPPRSQAQTQDRKWAEARDRHRSLTEEFHRAAALLAQTHELVERQHMEKGAVPPPERYQILERIRLLAAAYRALVEFEISHPEVPLNLQPGRIIPGQTPPPSFPFPRPFLWAAPPNQPPTLSPALCRATREKLTNSIQTYAEQLIREHT